MYLLRLQSTFSDFLNIQSWIIILIHKEDIKDKGMKSICNYDNQFTEKNYIEKYRYIIFLYFKI